MNKRTQVRGNCQRCGREQAIVKGAMAHHGYTVENGYFQGACTGHQHPPMQTRRDTTDFLVTAVREDAVRLDAQAARLKAGQDRPEMVKKPNELVKRGQTPTMVRFDSLGKYAQQRIIESLIFKTESRARSARSWANDMEALADKVHGTELRTVELGEGPAPILEGEKRVTSTGYVLTCSHVHGARVHWKNADGRKGWTGTQAWRRLAKV